MEGSRHHPAASAALARGCRLLILGLWVVGRPATGDAQNTPASGKDSGAAPEKDCFSLLNPTPREFMREMSTDRPDQTESPYTVDAGHVQVELDFVNATFDRDRSDGGDLRTTDWSIAPVNFKIGLLNHLDIQFLLESSLHARVEDRKAGTVSNVSGFGEVQTRLKLNLWGNDGGRTALGMMPFVKWPLPSSEVRNGKMEGGVIVPVSVDLGKGFDLGGMTEFDFLANDQGGYAAAFMNTITVGYELTHKLGMYLEFATTAGSAANFRWLGQVDVGWTYLLRENLQVDCGCNFGVTDSAPDFNPFAGMSWRF